MKSISLQEGVACDRSRVRRSEAVRRGVRGSGDSSVLLEMAYSLPSAHKAFSRLIQTDESTFSTSPVASQEPEALVAAIREQIVGEDQLFTGPFGDRKITYADYTASGRAVAAVENFVRDVVLPRYANTHTTTSVTGHQTSLFRHEAKMLVKRLVNANFSHGNAKVGVLRCLERRIWRFLLLCAENASSGF